MKTGRHQNEDLFGAADPNKEARALHYKIMREIEAAPENASLSALEKAYAPKMIEWRDGNDTFKKESVIIIRNGFRYRRNILRFFNGR